ncbi:hypothetical protein COCC4DRAFT_126865 [Bipolaris maydis ATCC 48331]|uniref:SMP domain-containing protein n=2 Tax=Cochliobolus heterostrophus TaxID=5016 RepID=M2URE6_COCH5|nr:uncharacterized protein COCC4DRAFT_126865 [Bipolaris maydis ATCC 48331]EMD90463.1 hypothetical protein COCHEDRAFT_16353 [Bipolaris maydis C5]KAJ5023714.1 hypothetical protein J3E73DRAFT_195261 [Bipolaris maydis]ENI09324.1 hypothetical protein COCC4DRAFT_126865 [Bipolaris maydis ATCC 48331]KAJ6195589.1 hypothetical protein J3E72DRAFT_195833 [Bipolaris maydis]KAJ6206370.1 hypothetical protein PSV09DRAFT_16353 [Bipolaris maydis]
MTSKFLRLNCNFLFARPTARLTSTPCLLRQSIASTNDLSNHSTRPFSLTSQQALQIDSNFISQITAAEKKITGSDNPVANGPTAKAQAHVGQTLTAAIIHDITMGEKTITGSDEPAKGGPTSIAQSALTSGNSNNSSANANTSSPPTTTTTTTTTPSGTLDSATLHKITEAEKKLTGQNRPVKDGPTAQAQSHAKEPITSQALHDITVGEKKVTGGERVKGGPTATAQSELSKSRA